MASRHPLASGLADKQADLGAVVKWLVEVRDSVPGLPCNIPQQKNTMQVAGID